MQLMKSAENSMQPMLGYLAWESVKGTGKVPGDQVKKSCNHAPAREMCGSVRCILVLYPDI